MENMKSGTNCETNNEVKDKRKVEAFKSLLLTKLMGSFIRGPSLSFTHPLFTHSVASHQRLEVGAEKERKANIVAIKTRVHFVHFLLFTDAYQFQQKNGN